MHNEAIAEYFSLLSKLMDIHGENSFKSKSYANAAFQIDRLPQPLTDMPPESWASLRGIGNQIAEKIGELLQTGSLKALDHLLAHTPAGVVEMLKIKGLGPKKIHTIWKVMDIESVGELLYACNENRLTLYKGFGEKTQQLVRDAITFMMAQEGKFLYQQAEPFAQHHLDRLHALFPDASIQLTGNMRSHEAIIASIDVLINLPVEKIAQAMEAQGEIATEQTTHTLTYQQPQAPALILHSCNTQNAGSRLCITTGHHDFIELLQAKLGADADTWNYADEATLFEAAGIAFVAPEHRSIAAMQPAYYALNKHKRIITENDIAGIIHSHSQWSDGTDSIEAMAKAAKAAGMEYLVISDHSQAATYAGGLRPEQIAAQHAEIDALNKQLDGFRIFKSIECDILGDGRLDYDDEILHNFDLVIASIHAGLRMPEDKAMHRLITAIENPYTLILGHLTGRLLLSRNGYPVNHKKIIDACAANQVVIELNAHPRRLDMDWHWIPYALEKDVLIAVNPDAHSIDGFADTRFGVLAAQKALLPVSHNLSSFGLMQFEAWLYDTRQAKGTL